MFCMAAFLCLNVFLCIGTKSVHMFSIRPAPQARFFSYMFSICGFRAPPGFFHICSRFQVRPRKSAREARREDFGGVLGVFAVKIPKKSAREARRKFWSVFLHSRARISSENQFSFSKLLIFFWIRADPIFLNDFFLDAKKQIDFSSHPWLWEAVGKLSFLLRFIVGGCWGA